MYKDPARNFDSAPLEAEHTRAQKWAKDKQKNLADKLLHRRCNRQKGAGDSPQQLPPQPPPKHKDKFNWAGVKILRG